MSQRLHEALADLEQQVAPLQLAPAEQVRARGTRRRRRRTAAVGTIALAGAAALAVVAVPALSRGTSLAVGQGSAPGASATGSPLAGFTSPVVDCSSPDPSHGNTVAVFLRDDITVEQQANIQSRLITLDGAATVTFGSKQDAYRDYRALLCWHRQFDNAASASPGLPSPGRDPASFVVTMKASADLTEVAQAVGRMPGVTEIVYPRRPS